MSPVDYEALDFVSWSRYMTGRVRKAMISAQDPLPPKFAQSVRQELGLASTVGVLCGLKGNPDLRYTDLFTKLLKFPPEGETINQSSLEPFVTQPHEAGEECLPRYTQPWWEDTSQPLKTLIDCLISFEQDRWQMTVPYRGLNVQPESLSFQQAKLFLTGLMDELHAACDLRCRQLLIIRGDLAGDTLEPPTFVDRQAQNSVQMADARQYLTEKLAEVQGRMQDCIHQMEAYHHHNQSEIFRLFREPSPNALLTRARHEGAEAARNMTADDISKLRLWWDEERDGVSYQEIWQVGNARRVVDPRWTSHRYTPQLLDMLEEPNRG